MDKYFLLERLPVYGNKKTLISKKQKVGHIISEILEAHKVFASDYDKISSFFNGDSIDKICSNLYSFCKKEIPYKVESEEMQTTKSPAAILVQGFGDCKHYASFCGGVLDAINRRFNKNIKWHYRFASYSLFNQEPEHIFTVVTDKGKEIWIDPTPGADKATPVWVVNKKINVSAMPLYRLSGVGQNNSGASLLLDNTVNTPELYMAIQLLLKYGVMQVNGKINDTTLIRLQSKLPVETFDKLYNARKILASAAIGGLFDTIWRGVKKVTLLVPRNAFLSLVGINAFGYATKLKKAVYNDNGTYTAYKDKLKTLWQDKLGGDWTALQNTFNNGANKKAILGAAPAAVPAWVATASAVIAAIMPLVSTILKQREKETGVNYNIDPVTGLPYGGFTGSETTTPTTGGGITDFIKENPLIIGAGLVGIYFLTKKKARA